MSEQAVQRIINRRKPKENNVATNDKKQVSADTSEAVDKLYKEFYVIYTSGISKLKTFSGLVKKIESKGKSFLDQLYKEAIQSEIKKHENIINQWRNLPDDHRNQKYVAECNTDKEQYVLNHITVNRRSKEYKLCKELYTKENFMESYKKKKKFKLSPFTQISQVLPEYGKGTDDFNHANDVNMGDGSTAVGEAMQSKLSTKDKDKLKDFVDKTDDTEEIETYIKGLQSK